MNLSTIPLAAGCSEVHGSSSKHISLEYFFHSVDYEYVEIVLSTD